jgi:hypothetical protein
MSIITVSSQTVLEGSSVTFTYGPIQNGLSIIWKIEGNIQSADFTSLIGVEKITTGKFSRSFMPAIDFADESNESFKLKIFTPTTTLAQVQAGGGTVLAESRLVSITDLRQTITASLSTTQTSFAEGSSITVKLQMQNVPNGTPLAYKIVGGPALTASDFSERTTLDGVVVVSASTFSIVSPGTAALSLYPSADFVTEGNETFSVQFFKPGVTLQQVRAGGVTPWVQTPTITITDLFQTATVAIVQNKTAFMEGDVIQIRLSTQNVQNRTPIYYQIYGSGITVSDFNSRSSLDGLVGVEATGIGYPINGSALLQLITVRDAPAEGTESFRVRFYRPGVTKEQVASGAIRDAWVETPSISLSDFTQTARVAISSTSATFTEGARIDMTLTTTNVPNNTPIAWRVMGDRSVTTADFIVGAMSGVVNVTNNIGTVSFTTASDFIDEGNETFKVSFYSPGTTLAQAMTSTTPWVETPLITITDLVQTAKVQALTKTSIQEGESLIFGVNTTNVPDGTPLVWRMVGSVSASDFANRFINGASMDGTVSIVRNAGSFTVATVNDMRDESPENFTVMLYRPKVTIQQAMAGATPWVQWPQVTLSDVPKSISVVTTPTKAFAEGSVVTFTIYTTGIPDGTFLIAKLEGVGVTPADFYNPSTAGIFTPLTSLVYTLTISRNTATLLVGLKKDGVREGPENFKLSVYSPGVTRQQAEAGGAAPWAQSAAYTILDA